MDFYHFVEIIFWFFVFLPVHSYIIYPLMLWVISSFYKQSKISSQFEFPFVSIIISAYNEEKVIESRIENISTQNYNFDKLELIIGSDCSSDKTNDILFSLSKKYSWLYICAFDERRGKAAVLNDLVKKAQGSIIVFSDANTEFEKDAISNLTKEFENLQIGGVSGKLELVEPLTNFDKSSQEKKYWEYEVLIKRMEGKIGILIGANGGIFAIRKELFEPIPVDKAVTDDLFITLTVLKKKYKFIYTFSAKAKEDTARDLKTEFNRKIRFASTNFQTLSYCTQILFNKNIFLSFSLWSHKVIRWFTPFFLVMIFIINIVLFKKSMVYQYTFYSQLIVYIVALLGFFLSSINFKIPIVTIIFYFVYSNIAIIIGFIRFITGSNSGIWKPTSR